MTTDLEPSTVEESRGSVRRENRLAASRKIVSEVTDLDPEEATIGIALIGSRSYIVASSLNEVVLIPVRSAIPVRRLASADALTFAWGEVQILKGGAGFLYSGFDLVAAGERFRLHVAKPWRELIKELKSRTVSP